MTRPFPCLAMSSTPALTGSKVGVINKICRSAAASSLEVFITSYKARKAALAGRERENEGNDVGQIQFSGTRSITHLDMLFTGWTRCCGIRECGKSKN